MMKKNFYPSNWSNEIVGFLDSYISKGYRMLKKPKSQLESSQVDKNYVGSPKEFFPNVSRFDYQFFYNEKTEVIEGIVYFGECLQGPIGCVHGGAISTIVDAIMGTNVWCCRDDAVTLNLNVNFRKFIKLKSFKRIVSRVTKRENKKIFVESKILGLDLEKKSDKKEEEEVEDVYCEATSLYYKFTEKRGCLDLEDYGFAFPIQKESE